VNNTQSAEISNHPGFQSRSLITIGGGAAKAIAVALVVTLLHLSLASAAMAEDPTIAAEERKEATASQFGLGAASFFLTLPYGMVKVVYATLGGIIGGFTYALTAGNERAAKAVWDTSLRGTYIITPDHLKGERAVRFFGSPPESAPEAVVELSTEPAASLSTEPASSSGPSK
jgi:hypothetical protein